VGYRQLVGRHGVFKVTVSDVDDDNEYELIGECEITLDDIVNGNKTEFTLIDEDKNSCNGKITINSFLAGVVCVNNIKTRSQESIIDYIFSGLQINLQVAIDFTYSNGNQK
jgi:hypothetical protein